MKRREPVVLQLIDSLEPGGAERVCVNFANALHRAGIGSFLCATRRGGPLRHGIDPAVGVLILHKRSVFDPAALLRLVRFVRRYGITIIHAHSTSYATALLCKALTGVKVVWHDHNGARRLVRGRAALALKSASRLFDAAVAANRELEAWSRENLHVDQGKIAYIRNFATLEEDTSEPALPGTERTRLICVANLRAQKDHMTLLNAFAAFHSRFPQWHLLLVGRDDGDAYSKTVHRAAAEKGLQPYIHFLGGRSDIPVLLRRSTVGVLSSASEGLPVALLEYGLAGLPVVCTDVGECGEAVGGCGYTVPPGDAAAFSVALEHLAADEGARRSFAVRFHERVREQYGEKATTEKLLNLYRSVMDVR